MFSDDRNLNNAILETPRDPRLTAPWCSVRETMFARSGFWFLLLSLVAHFHLGRAQRPECRSDYSDCCRNEDFDSTHDDDYPSLNFCDRMIPKDTQQVRPEGSLSLRCDPGFRIPTAGAETCTWTTPAGRVCVFGDSYDGGMPRDGETCDEDGEVIWEGDLKAGKCDIRIDKASFERHNGTWMCELLLVTRYADTVDVAVNALSTAALVGLTVPLGLLGLALLIGLLIFCLCPALCPCCPCGGRGKDGGAPAPAQTEPNYDNIDSARRPYPLTSQPPLPPLPQRGPHADHDQDLAEEESDGFSYETERGFRLGDARNKKRYDPVVYTHPVRPEVAPEAQPKTKTARKISNTISLHSFGPKRDRAKNSAAY